MLLSNEMATIRLKDHMFFTTQDPRERKAPENVSGGSLIGLPSAKNIFESSVANRRRVRPSLGQMAKLRPVARKTGPPNNMDGAGLLQNGGSFSKRRNTRQTKVVMPSNLGVLYYTAAAGPLSIVFCVNGVC